MNFWIEEFKINFKMRLFDFINPEYPSGINGYLVWEQIPEYFSKFNLLSYEGEINAEIDWDHLLEALHRHRVDKKVKDDIWIKCVMAVPKDVSPNRLGVEGRRNYLGNHLLNFLYSFYLILNLSSPGCACFYPTTIDFGLSSLSIIKLSAILMSCTWDTSMEYEWPEIVHIPLEQTFKWFQKINFNYRQIALTKLEKTLFAVLQIIKSNSFNFNDLIWLAHGLEALYDSPRAEIVKTIQERIFKVLNTPETKFRSIKKELNRFYNLRSRFVHGDLDIPHPLSNECLDKKIEKINDELGKIIIFTFTIIVASLQKLVLNNWKELSFSEIYTGIN